MIKFITTICLIFTHYVCGSPCIVEKDTSVDIAANVIFSSVYSDKANSNFYNHTKYKQSYPDYLLQALYQKKPKDEKTIIYLPAKQFYKCSFLHPQGNAKYTWKSLRIK